MQLKRKCVYAQLIKCPFIQIVATIGEAREWLRINGSAIEVHDLEVKQAMLDDCPGLSRHFQKSNDENFALFVVDNMEAFLCDGGNKTLLT